MSRSNNRLFFVLVACILFVETISAQLPESTPILTNTKETGAISTAEKIYLHSDKSFYTAGEILWFKIYVLNAQTNHLSLKSKVAYVELLDAKNTPLLQAKIALNGKGGNGSFQLPLGLTSGYFKLRCYTNWMKNQGLGSFFEKQITVVNPLKSLESNTAVAPSLYRLDIFPEGGDLVKGLLSRVAFKFSKNNGKGADGRGYLLDEKDTVLRFQPFKFGLGSFDFRPQPGHVYKIVFVANDGNIISKILPEPVDKGYVMRVEEFENRLKVTVRTNVSAGYPEVFLQAQTRGETKTTQRSVVADGIATFYVAKSDLGEGVSQLTVFDNQKQPVCERLFFMRPVLSQIGTLTTDKSVYSTRSQVSLLSDSATAMSASSLAVYQLDPLQTPETVNISNYVWLISELRGEVEDPAYYFSSDKEDVKQATDYLMLTQGWRRFQSKESSGKKAANQFTSESSGQLITARVTDKQTNEPASDVQVFLSIPTTKFKLFSSRSDKNGFVRFAVQDYSGPGDLILQTNSQKDSVYKIEILSPFSTDYTDPIASDPLLEKSNAGSLVNHSVDMQTQQIYLHDSIRKFLSPFIQDTFPYYGQSIYTYKLDDYTRFTTMEEVLREYVREINVGVKGSGSSLRIKMFNEDERELYTQDLLVTVDGVPFFNPNVIFTVDPLKIRKIDIITKNYVLGNSIYHALANFVSYQGDFKNFEPDSKATVIDYEGLQLQREFYSPDYSTEGLRNSRLPDLRSTLYWQPNVSTTNLTFYTGDNKGKYIAVLQGMTPDGKTIFRSVTFEVK